MRITNRHWSVSANITSEEYNWLDAETLRLGLPGKGAVIRALIVDAMQADAKELLLQGKEKNSNKECAT